MSKGTKRFNRRLNDRRYNKMRVYERALIAIRRSRSADARELRGMAHQALNEANRDDNS